MDNSQLQYDKKVTTSVSLANKQLEQLLYQHIITPEVEEQLILQNEIELLLQQEQKQLDSFVDNIMQHFSLDYDSFSLGSQTKLITPNSKSPFVSIQANRKSFSSLYGKVVRKLFATEQSLYRLENSGKIIGPNTIKDVLRVRVTVEDGNKAAIDDVMSGFSDFNPKNIKYLFPGFERVKNYTARPKQNGYGEFGAKHFSIYFADPKNSPLRPIEVQILTQEQVYQARRDSYHGCFKKSFSMPEFTLLNVSSPEVKYAPFLHAPV